MNTDFLVCAEDDPSAKLATVEDIVKHLRIRHGDMNETPDYEFVSSEDLVKQVADIKVRNGACGPMFNAIIIIHADVLTCRNG